MESKRRDVGEDKVRRRRMERFEMKKGGVDTVVKDDRKIPNLRLKNNYIK